MVPYVAAGFEVDLNQTVSVICGASNTFKKAMVPRMSVGTIGINYHI
jgi:hypothetical protein